MAGFTTYKTKQGDTWATIAWQAYGDVNEIDRIIAANPYTPASAVLDGEIEIRVPILESSSVSSSLLPPWKR